jgi:hypothetical protein
MRIRILRWVQPKLRVDGAVDVTVEQSDDEPDGYRDAYPVGNQHRARVVAPLCVERPHVVAWPGPRRGRYDVHADRVHEHRVGRV